MGWKRIVILLISIIQICSCISISFAESEGYAWRELSELNKKCILLGYNRGVNYVCLMKSDNDSQKLHSCLSEFSLDANEAKAAIKNIDKVYSDIKNQYISMYVLIGISKAGGGTIDNKNLEKLLNASRLK